jgi:hypothetical protein
MLRSSNSSISFAVVFLAASLAGLWTGVGQAQPVGFGQQPDRPTDKLKLDSILARLDDNIDDFNQTVPTFFSREEVQSEVEPGPSGKSLLRTHTASTFIVRRSGDPDDPDDPASDTDNPTQANQLHESRVIRVIDEKGFIKPEKGANKFDTGSRMDSPYVIFGIFSGGMTRISTAGKVCFHYHLRPARKGHDANRIVIDFESWPRKDRGINCPYSDRISGRGFIDAASMRMIRLENAEHDDKGTWNWSVDYAPIALGSKTFWLPTIIRSEDMASTDTMNTMTHALTRTTVTHRLTARYSQYRQPKGHSSPTSTP